MTVLGSNVLLEPKEEKKSIILSSNEEELSKYATVLSVGELVRTIKPGDEIYWSARAGTPLKIDDKELIITDASTIFCIFDKQQKENCQ